MNAKPFIKWVGGKNKLIDQIEMNMPSNFRTLENVVYIEPFVGGGAMFFHMMETYPNIKKAVINDVNKDLITCYKTIRDHSEELIRYLYEINKEYNALESLDKKKELFLKIREKYNEKKLDEIENTTAFIFLNKTDFNALYRVNKKGLFNVPFGQNEKVSIYNEEIILNDSKILKNVEILSGDFEDTISYAQGNTLFYFDPPYRPLNVTSSFTSYTKEGFNDDDQIRLKKFCDTIHERGFSFMLSNSDGKNNGTNDTFLYELYKDYFIEQVIAARCINSNPTKRGKLTEILVHNYK